MPDTSIQEAHPKSINACLAAYFTEENNNIVDELMQRLRKADKIETGTLTNSELKNHVPRIIDNLARELLHYGCADAAMQTHIDAAEHGATRWRQGFDLSGLLRESSLLRAVLIDYICHFEEENPTFGYAEKFFASATTHRILDDVMIEAAQQFRITQVIEGKR